MTPTKKNRSSKPGRGRSVKRTERSTPAAVARSNKLVAKGRTGKPSTSVALSPADPLLQAYLREVSKYPLLTREEEHELAVRFFEKGDRDALHRLVTGNLRFVVKIAYEYVHYRTKLLDLIQEGNMGLVKAVQEFDPYKDVRLTTYAVWWIRSYIQDSILRNYSLVKIGTTQAQKKLFYRLRAEQNRLEQMGIVPQNNVKLLASRLEVREKDIQEMDQRMGRADLSLNAPLSGDDATRGDRTDHMQALADPSEPADVTLGDVEQREIFSKILRQFSETLEGREKVIFNDRLVAEDPLTLQEIGDKYGITKERARQLEEQIKKKLKAYVKEKYPDYELLSNSLA